MCALFWRGGTHGDHPAVSKLFTLVDPFMILPAMAAGHSKTTLPGGLRHAQLDVYAAADLRQYWKRLQGRDV